VRLNATAPVWPITLQRPCVTALVSMTINKGRDTGTCFNVRLLWDHRRSGRDFRKTAVPISDSFGTPERQELAAY
jgi:hypothetical protein